jgi:archaellum biogenesis protein FlaJ (TadC family)
MLEKYYKKIKITNQVVLLITLSLIIMFFVEIDMNVLLIPNAQKIPLNAPFLAVILISVLFLNGLIARIIFIKERQKNKVYQEEKDVE